MDMGPTKPQGLNQLQRQESPANKPLYPNTKEDYVKFFTQKEVDSTNTCLKNSKVIIKDYEAQLDWHLEQYMTIGSSSSPKENTAAVDMTVSNLRSLLSDSPDQLIMKREK